LRKKKELEWSKLDNAAKIFPANSSKSDTKVFRVASELVDDIDKETLQKALDMTIDSFPLYKSIIRSGLFWYYFEKSDIKPLVQEENMPPCSALYDKNNKTLLFRVMYYKKRISVEVYHALSDGAGAVQFLRTLVFFYLIIKYPDKFKDENVPFLDYMASRTQKMDDSFQKYYSRDQNSLLKKKWVKAYRIKGQKLPEYRIKVIEGVMPVDSLLKVAKEYDTTITIFLAAVLICSINDEVPVRHKKRPVVLSIPVNLRNYWDSETARNFFGVINVGYNFREGSGELTDVISHLKLVFKDWLTPEYLGNRMNELAALEHNFIMRAIPLAIKDIALRIAGRIVEGSYTSTLSNVGKITMPDEMNKYITSFDIFVSTNKLQACVGSYKNKIRISFTSAFVSAEIQRHFFTRLTGMGIPVEIASNNLDD
jgi:NRPS condensation-like uncharacterized protein